MKYIKVKWKHANPQYPSTLYSELDKNRWEIRKIEIYANGWSDFANSSESTGNTHLGIEPVPSLEEITTNSEFEASEIDSAEFEQIWAKIYNLNCSR